MAALAVSLLSAQNLIQDQSFEKKYDNWTMWNGDCVDNSKSHSCKYAAHCKLRESQILIATQKSAVQLQPNTDYVYSGCESGWRRNQEVFGIVEALVL